MSSISSSASRKSWLRGAITAAYGVDPEVGLAVDVTRTGDTPMGVKMEVALGADLPLRCAIPRSSLIRGWSMWMVAEAKAQKLPYQMEVLEAGAQTAQPFSAPAPACPLAASRSPAAISTALRNG